MREYKKISKAVISFIYKKLIVGDADYLKMIFWSVSCSCPNPSLVSLGVRASTSDKTTGRNLAPSKDPSSYYKPVKIFIRIFFKKKRYLRLIK